MHKMAFVALAMAMLCACASLEPSRVALASNLSMSFDAAGAAPVEAPVEVLAPAIARISLVVASPPLGRRQFSPPSGRQPELRAILATASDRLRRHARRRRTNVIKGRRRASHHLQRFTAAVFAAL